MNLPDPTKHGQDLAKRLIQKSCKRFLTSLILVVTIASCLGIATASLVKHNILSPTVFTFLKWVLIIAGIPFFIFTFYVLIKKLWPEDED